MTVETLNKPEGLVESTVSEEALQNQERTFTHTLAMVVHGNDDIRKNGGHTTLHEGLSHGHIDDLPALGDFISHWKTSQDAKNGLGRELFNAVESAKDEFSRFIEPEILEDKFPKWLGETFGEDRLTRWQSECHSSNGQA